MKQFVFVLFIMASSLNSVYAESDPMSGKKLEDIVREFTEDKLEIENHVIKFMYKEVPLYCIYDESNDRMRIISPIKRYNQVTEEEKNSMMEANFHRALDARYASSGGVLYSAYIHPLSPLKKSDLLYGIYQVVSLFLTFGDEYSSSTLTFGDQGQEPLKERI
ncbi:MAG: hypothetical protein AAGA18_13085 [Verrucomicrobiota bacterium]